MIRLLILWWIFSTIFRRRYYGYWGCRHCHYGRPPMDGWHDWSGPRSGGGSYDSF